MLQYLLISLGNLRSGVAAAPLHRREDDRSSTWQVLADGTQDLAALVGLFATDSVERYAMDYSRGYMGAAMSSISMLGILGYVRALVKLTMGSSACVSAAFPTVPVRALLGVAKEDRLPGEELVTVTYIQRNIVGQNVIWRKIKSIYHTKESMPLTWAHAAVGKDRKPQMFLLEAGRKTKQLLFSQNPPYLWHVILSIICTTGINSFAILLIGSGWTWYKYIASIVTFLSLLISSLIWAWIYIKEQVPLFSDDSTLWLDPTGEFHKNRCGSVAFRSNKTNAAFCFIEIAGSYILVPCSTLTPLKLYIIRVFSGFMAITITFGYICQYIVVRQSSQTESLRWLLIQGGLTLLRLLVWLYPSPLTLRIFDNKNAVYRHLLREPMSSFQSHSGLLYGSAFSDYRTITELELAVTSASTGVDLDEFSIPQDILESLKALDLVEPFHDILDLTDSWVQKVKVVLRGESVHQWIIPPLLFRKLLLQRSNDYELSNIEFSEELLIGDRTFLMLNLADNHSWSHSTITLIPLIQLTVRIDMLDGKGVQVGSPIVQKVFCTCLSAQDPSQNLVEITDSYWAPFNEILPRPKDPFLWGKFSHFRVVLETGEAGDASIDSELTIDGYTERWPNFRKQIEQATSLLDISKRDGPERSLIHFVKESRLLDEVMHPEIVRPSESTEPVSDSKARTPVILRKGKNEDVIIEIPHGGLLEGSSTSLGKEKTDS